MSDSSPVSLGSLPVGARARILEIRLGSSDKPRLMEMGLLVGTPIEVVRFAPLGDPVEIKLRGYHLSIRRQDADKILVAPAAS